MPPKRKAPTSAASQRAAKSGRASLASTPGPATPRSMGSSDEFSEPDNDLSDGEKATLDSALGKFTIGGHGNAYKGKAMDSASRYFGKKDYSWLRLKPDHDNRPLYMDDDGRIILESFNPLAAQAQDFLITIAEPLSRPSFLHEYKLNVHSLYAAVSVGLNPQDIINTLNRFLKTPLPEIIAADISNITNTFGKVKLVLKNTKYYLESSDADMLQRLIKDPIIGPLRVMDSGGITTSSAPKLGGLVIPGTKNAAGVNQAKDLQKGEKDAAKEGENGKSEDIYDVLNDEDDDDAQDAVHAFEVEDSGIEAVKKQCLGLGFPVLEEYDFRNDEANANLDIDLRPAAQIRPYQEKSLSKMFGNGRAKSGIIVLPCGAGKTLVGITAACTVKKGIMVLCTSSMSVSQWRQEFLKWSNINPDDIAVFTSESKVAFKGNTGIIVTTYSMMAQTGKRSHSSEKMMNFIKNREWGLMLLDEVHVVPANYFRTVTSNVKSHSKLGLTATLLREDDKISDLNFLIGPKLYEANWMELSQQGHIAKVQCAEVWCPMPTEFYDEYLKNSSRENKLLYVMNPNKFQACQYLIEYHENRGDKIIVFSDDVFALRRYAQSLGKAFIYGQTGQTERMQLLENFQYNPQVNTLFLSKIGDTSLDLPEATVLIQISSHFGSRRQEAQRLGRILRAKRRNDEGFSAFFYTLVSKDTQEMFYSSKRQAFLVDQGYAFKVITQLTGIEDNPRMTFRDPKERRELLQDVLLQIDKSKAGGADLDGNLDNLWEKTEGKTQSRNKKGAKRTAGSLKELSGAQDMAYIEQRKSANKGIKKAAKSQFFKQLDREKERRKKAAKEDN